MKLRSPLLENCCCCISNRTGALIFAYLSLVGYIILLLGALVNMGFGTARYHSYQPRGTNYANYQEHVSAAFMIFTSIPTIFASILGIVFTAMLLNGIHKNKALFMIPWLTLQIYAAVYTFGIILSILIVNIYYMSAIGVPLLVILLALQIYCIMCVFSSFQEMNINIHHIQLDLEANPM